MSSGYHELMITNISNWLGKATNFTFKLFSWVIQSSLLYQTKVFAFMKLEWSWFDDRRILSIQLVGLIKWHQIKFWTGYLDGNNPEVLPSNTCVNCAVVTSDKVKAISLMSEFRTIFYLFLLRICIYNLASLLITTSRNMCNNKWSENLFIGWFRYTFDIGCIDLCCVTWHDLPPHWNGWRRNCMMRHFRC